MLKDRTLLLAKIEAVYGTDPVPVAGTNAVLCSVPEFSVVGRKVERLNALQFMGVAAGLNIGEALRIKFKCEIKGKGGVADVPPEFGCLLRACNFTENITPATKVEYVLNSAVGIPDSSESVTIYFQQHNLLHKILGARGTVKFDLKAGEYGVAEFELTGLYGGAVDNAITAGTFNATLPPRFVSGTFTIDAYAAVINQLTFDLANKIAKRIDANAATGIKEWLITDREPKFSVDPEAIPIATKDIWGMWEDSTQVAVTAQLGSDVGNICKFDAPKALCEVPSYAERDNLLTFGINGQLHPTAAGNDELKLTFQ